MQQEKINNCKIAEHIPREDGMFCECGYFIQKDLCVKLLIEDYVEDCVEWKVGGDTALFQKLVEKRINKYLTKQNI